MKPFNRVRRRIRGRDRKRPAFHLNFELCEDRVLLAIPILVTTAADNGNNLDPTPGSLRQAIITANSTPGQDTIDFNIPGPGPFIIQPPRIGLPTITDQVILDGSTERTFLGLPAAGPPVIQLNGNGLPGDGLVLGFTPPGPSVGGTSSAGSAIIGLDIYNFKGGYGIHIQTNGNMITDNFLGTDVNGTAAGPGNGTGVLIDNSASNNTIGGTGAGAGNVISGNSGDGIEIGFPSAGSGDGNLVLGNKIGTNAAGTAALGNGTPGSGLGGAGVRFFAGTSNTVANNVISGNVNEGIFFHGNLGASHEMVLGNLIGTNATGTAPIGNGLSGITLNLQTAANTISGNVISGNGVGPSHGNGISLAAGAHDNLIQANLIGTNAAGTAALGNTLDGISLNDASNNRIIGNVVSGNGINQDAAGINLESNDLNNIIAGNKIGTNAAGTAALGNSLLGIFLGNGSSNNTIGGTTVNDRNVISGNGKFPVADFATQGGVGVYIFGSGATDNMVLGNFIGTNAAGTAALNKSVIGVLINESPGNTVQDNLISGNRFIGLEIAGGTASGNLVQSNKIGTNAGGTAAIPNGGDGIFINNAPNNTIGGTAAGAGNRISGNGFFGIQLFGPLTSGNVIQGNIISGNRVGGILVNTNRFANQIDGAGPGQANQGQARPIFRLARRARSWFARSGRDR